MDRALEIVQSFERIWLERCAVETPLGQKLLSLVRPEIVEKAPFVKTQKLTALEISQGKKTLFVRNHDGHFFKRCPGSTQKTALTCCNYYVLNLGSQCNFDCSYCYLQSYLNQAPVQVFANIDQALNELREMAQQHGHLPYRVGTGEITDSLSLDPLTEHSKKLIDFFSMHPKWTLEFKTKSNFVEQFLDCPHAGNVVVSWSINPESVVQSEEHGTASLAARLLAAEKCVQKGFPVAFHLDPMFWFKGWEEQYQDLVQQICRRFHPEQVSVISLGSLRIQPEQRHLMRQRFSPKSLVNRAELQASAQGKWRYDQSLRQKMSSFVLSEFKKRSSQWRVFLCMETPETWASAFQSTPMQQPELRDLFRPLPKPKFEETTHV